MDRRFPIVAVLLLGAACSRAPVEPMRFAGTSMGTTYSVQLVEIPVGVDAGALRDEVEGLVRSVDERMSTYDPESELSRFNAAASTDWFPVTADTQAVVAEALRVSRLSRGAFDVTVGPLVDLWGFGPAGSPRAVPEDVDVAAARECVGQALLETRGSPPALRKRAPCVTVDLSGLAKGFAVDLVARHLDDAGVRHYLVEIGGELRARGRNAGGEPWRVALERPEDSGRSVQCVVQLVDGAIATSGDYRNFFQQDGRRYAHVIDPRTGRPVEHGIASVTVLAATAIEADAFATALMVLEPEQGLGLAGELGLSVHSILRSGDGFVELSNPGFEKQILH